MNWHSLCIHTSQDKKPVLRIRIQDPGSGAFMTLDPGSGIRDPEQVFSGSQTHIFYSLMTNLLVKSTSIILNVLATQNFFTCSKLKLFTILRYLWLEKMEGQQNFPPPLLVLLLDPRSGSGIQDSRWIKIKIRDLG